jgi:hypothetical protein
MGLNSLLYKASVTFHFRDSKPVIAELDIDIKVKDLIGKDTVNNFTPFSELVILK